MLYRRLGRSGVKVSEVGLGGWLTHGRSLDDSGTAAIVQRAYDLGVNFFDTADVYNNGKAERALGVAIKGLRRQSLVLATKCYFPMSDSPNDQGLSRKHIVESCHDSLRRLGTDYIDLYQFHRFDHNTPLEETVRAVDDLIRQGKVLYWGVSQWPSTAIVDAAHTAARVNANAPVSNQPAYNMLNREIEQSVIPASLAHGLGQVVYSPLAQGVLSGKYRPGVPPPPGSRGSDDTSNQFMGQYLTEENLAKLEKVSEIAKRAGASLALFALAWCLRLTNVSSVIVGATRAEQIEENAKASGLEFEPALFREAEEILSA